MIYDFFHWSRRYKRDIPRRETRFAHIGFILPTGPPQRIQAGHGFKADFVLFPAAGLDQPGGRTTQSVTRTFRFTAVAVENSQFENIVRWCPKNKAIGTNSKIPVTDPLRKLWIVRRN